MRDRKSQIGKKREERERVRGREGFRSREKREK